jgi:hypothetical protein
VPEILNRTDKIGFGTPGMNGCYGKMAKSTIESYNDLASTFPDIFKKMGPYVKKDMTAGRLINYQYGRTLLDSRQIQADMKTTIRAFFDTKK